MTVCVPKMAKSMFPFVIATMISAPRGCVPYRLREYAGEYFRVNVCVCLSRRESSTCGEVGWLPTCYVGGPQGVLLLWLSPVHACLLPPQWQVKHINTLQILWIVEPPTSHLFVVGPAIHMGLFLVVISLF